MKQESIIEIYYTDVFSHYNMTFATSLTFHSAAFKLCAEDGRSAACFRLLCETMII